MAQTGANRSGLGHALLAMLLASACAHDTNDSSHDVDDATRACLQQNPAVPPVADAELLSEAVADCDSDSGACQASTACVGSVDDRVCDADILIGPAAATCIAEAHDLPPGLEGIRADLAYNFGFRRLIWNVMTTRYDTALGTSPDAGVGDRGGTSMSIDAISGEILGTVQWDAFRN